MRSRSRPVGAAALILAGLSAALAGCSSGGSQDTLSTSSLGPPRPQAGMAPYPQRTYPDGSSYGRPYTLPPQRTAQAPAGRQYVDPGTPTPQHMAAAPPYGSSGMQTASIGPNARSGGQGYDPNARWQQPSPIVTGSTGPSAYGAQPHVIEVREGDTLFGLSRRYNVPVNDLVAANRLTSDRIAIGQRLVIPTRYR